MTSRCATAPEARARASALPIVFSHRSTVRVRGAANQGPDGPVHRPRWTVAARGGTFGGVTQTARRRTLPHMPRTTQRHRDPGRPAPRGAPVRGRRRDRLGRTLRGALRGAGRRHADEAPRHRRLAAFPARHRIPTCRAAYAPGDLRSTADAGLNGGYKVRAHVIADLKAMASAARAAGARLSVQSAYRSYATQQSPRSSTGSTSTGTHDALKESARAGHSEHQLGTTLDFRSYGGPAPWDVADWATIEGREVDEGERLEVRLRDVVSEGQDGGHVLRLRAVALPLRRQGPCRGHPRVRG